MTIQAKDVMTKNVVSVTSDAGVNDVCELMLRHHISGMPVVDGEGRLEGVISEYDLLRLLYEPSAGGDSVANYLTKDVTTVEEHEMLCDVVEKFLECGMRRIPIVDSHNKVVGVISRRDVVRFIYELHKTFEEQIETLCETAGVPMKQDEKCATA